MTSAPPPRRLSPRVYRRRRAVVLIVLVVIVLGVVLAISRPWSGSSEPAPAATPTKTPLPTIYPTSADGTSAVGGRPTDTTSGPATCTSADIAVVAITDASSYSAGTNPQLSLSLTNRSGRDCTINAGTTQQVFTVMSGSDMIWTSTDCQVGGNDLEILLTAGQSITGSPITWDRTRSSAQTCNGGREAVTAGGAAYNLSVSIAGFSSASSTQFLLN